MEVRGSLYKAQSSTGGAAQPNADQSCSEAPILQFDGRIEVSPPDAAETGGARQ